MNIVSFLILLLILSFLTLKLTRVILKLLRHSLAQVPAYHYGVVERRGRRLSKKYNGLAVKLQSWLTFAGGLFGKREGGTLYEGLHITAPFLDTVQGVSMALTTKQITVAFNTKDRPRLTCEFSLQYRPDPAVTDSEGRNRFVEMTEKTLDEGIPGDLQSKIGGIGTKYDSLEFVDNRQAIGDIINCFLRTNNPPHLQHVHETNDTSPDKQKSKETCGLEASCKFKQERIDTPDLVSWYNAHWPLVRKILRDESGNTDARSPFELRYGIDVVNVPLSDVKFPSDVEKALAQKRQIEESRKAFADKKAMIRELMEAGATFQEANNAVETHTGQAGPRKIYSIEGGGQAVIVPGLGDVMRNTERKSGKEGRE